MYHVFAWDNSNKARNYYSDNKKQAEKKAVAWKSHEWKVKPIIFVVNF